MSETCGCSGSCCSTNARNEFIVDSQSTVSENIPIVPTNWSWPERLGAWAARWGINRMSYKVAPGLYGVGSPTSDSPVLVTANYKMTFDLLRRELTNIDAWILVLDTKGINVWCAAGKGTFGTDELVKRIRLHKLENIVNHKKIIVPQLGAVGVAAHEVVKQTRFKVIFGPVSVKDIPAYLATNRVTAEMRRMPFSLWDRLVLTPMEIVPGLKNFAVIAVVMAVFQFLAGLFSIGIFLSTLIPYGGGLMIGAVLVPALLPWIPFRSFALKGALLGVLFILAYHQFSQPELLQRGIELLIVPGLASYLAVNFTGSTTFTSLSGVNKELALAIPMYISAAVLGFILIVIDIVRSWV